METGDCKGQPDAVLPFRRAKPGGMGAPPAARSKTLLSRSLYQVKTVKGAKRPSPFACVPSLSVAWRDAGVLEPASAERSGARSPGPSD